MTTEPRGSWRLRSFLPFAAAAVGLAAGVQAGPVVKLLRPKPNARFVVGQTVFLAGAVTEGKKATHFGFQVNRQVVYKSTLPPYAGVWDTGGFDPGRYRVLFRARVNRETYLSKSIPVELVAPPAGLDMSRLSRKQRQQWAVAFATLGNRDSGDTGDWLAVFFTDFLVWAAAQLEGLPFTAPGSAEQLLTRKPHWIRAPEAAQHLDTLAAPGREACLVDGFVEAGPGRERPTTPVRLTLRVWSGTAKRPVLAQQVSGTLSDLQRIAAEAAHTMIGALGLFLTSQERQAVRQPLKADYATFRLTSRALAAASRGETAQAEDLLNEARAHAPTNPLVKIAEARIRLLRQDFMKALDALETASRWAAADAGTRRTVDLLLLDAANQGYTHYRADQQAERWRCAEVAADHDSRNPVALVRWMQLVYTMEPTPENFRRMAHAGDRLLTAQPRLTSTGILGKLLENVIVAHLDVQEDSQATKWLNRAKAQLKLVDWLWLRYHAYRKATHREAEAIDAGNNLLAFAPVEQAAPLLRELVGLVKESRGPREARTYLEDHAPEVWKRASTQDQGRNKVRVAQEIARAWADLGDSGRQKKWADRAAGGK